jgi:phosphatidylglycerol lysyltransferase
MTARQQAHAPPVPADREGFARIRRILPPLLGIALFAVALLFLHGSVAHLHYVEVLQALREITPSRILFALAFTALSFVALAGYDWLALRMVGRPKPWRSAALASFVAQSIAHSTGFATLVAGAVRYRFYVAEGLSLTDVAKVQALFGLTYCLGFASLCGVALAVEPQVMAPAALVPAGIWRSLGFAMLLGVALYVAWAAALRAPVRIFGRELPRVRALPAIAQTLFSIADLSAAAAALYVLLPPEAGISYFRLLGAYLPAILLGVASHVPGGIGVVESALLLLLAPAPEHVAGLAGALIAFRFIYYLLPLLLGAAAFGLVEVGRLEGVLGQASAALRRTADPLAPLAFAVLAFVAGLVLLVSGATPSAPGRLELVSTLVPHALIEISHFSASLIGTALLMLSHALGRRMAGAWLLTAILLGLGIAASLLKGLDVEEAAMLTAVLAVLLPCRPAFYRRSALVEERFSPGWLAAVAVAIAASIWLIFFAYKHVEYSHDLWWRFALEEDAPRSLRAAVGAAALALGVAIFRLLRPSAPHLQPSAGDLAQVRALVEQSPLSQARLALTGDKSFFFDRSRRAFVMYAINGRTWAVAGEPIGDHSLWPELLWDFRALVDRHGGWPAFYEVGPDTLPLFLDLGLSAIKLGERARVALPAFGLDGKAKADLRYAHRRAMKEGAHFEVLRPEAVGAAIEELRAVSDAWLSLRNASEKRFSLGFFSADYLMTGPVAVVRREGRVVAFANLWPGAGNEECSIDLMRYAPGAPHGTMDYLLSECMLWAKAQGYAWFDLGMAPLSGLPDNRLAPLWAHFGRVVFQHGSHFYNFAGLRGYKEKFEPVWVPAYLIYPRRALPFVIADIAALIGGGWLGLARRQPHREPRGGGSADAAPPASSTGRS